MNEIKSFIDSYIILLPNSKIENEMVKRLKPEKNSELEKLLISKLRLTETTQRIAILRIISRCNFNNKFNEEIIKLGISLELAGEFGKWLELFCPKLGIKKVKKIIDNIVEKQKFEIAIYHYNAYVNLNRFKK